MKDKTSERWQHWVLAAIVLFFVILIPTILVIAVISLKEPYEKQKTNNIEAIKEVYKRFESINSANEVFCASQYNYASFDYQTIHHDTYSLENCDYLTEKESDYKDIYFDHYVFSTSDYYYFSYAATRDHKSYSYWVFKSRWDNNDKSEYVVGIDDLYIPSHSQPTFYKQTEAGFLFLVNNSNKQATYDIYECNIFENNIFNLNISIDQNSWFSDIGVEKSSFYKNDNVNVSKNDTTYSTSFSQTCPNAYNLAIDLNFKPDTYYQLDNLTLFIYSKVIGGLDYNMLMAVFSYDWNNNQEKFQGLYYTKGRYNFYHVQNN